MFGKKNLPAVVISVFLLIGLSLWLTIDHLVIPKFIIPRINAYISDFNQTSPLKLKVDNIDFSFISGFCLKGITLNGAEMEKNILLKAEEVDIDLNLPALLWKKIEIRDIEIERADLTLSRDSRGRFNFEEVFKQGLMEERPAGPFALEIKRINLKDSRIFYSDDLHKRNRLKRNIHEVNLSMINDRGSLYKIKLSGLGEKGGEALFLQMEYDGASQEVKGETAFNTELLAEYWDYYLDELFKPWRLKAGSVKARIKFVYAEKTLDLNGHYDVRGAAVSYGDLNFKAGLAVDQQQRYVPGAPHKGSLRLDVTMDPLAFYGKDNKIFDRGRCRAVLTEKLIDLKEISGQLGESPFEFKGRFVFGYPRKLDLDGRIGKVRNKFDLKLISENQAVVSWLASAEGSYVKASAEVSDLKNMLFNMRLNGALDLEHVPSKVLVEADQEGLSVEAESGELRGRMEFSGDLKGEADKPKSLSGKLGIRFIDLSVLDLPPASFLLGMKVEEGSFKAGIPKIEYYKGTLSGAVVMDAQRWGVGLKIDKCDIAELGKTDERLRGMKGIFTGNLVCVGSWGRPDSIKGGGYFKVTDCNLKEAPLFEAASQGMESVTHGFVMPEFEMIEGNYEIGEGGVTFDNIYCQAANLSLLISGKYNFSGDSDFTVGVRFFKKGFWNTMRQIVFPVTIGLDIITDSVMINLTGSWPDLRSSARIQPMEWFNRFFGESVKYDPQRYSLDKVWQKQ